MAFHGGKEGVILSALPLPQLLLIPHTFFWWDGNKEGEREEDSTVTAQHNIRRCTGRKDA